MGLHYCYHHFFSCFCYSLTSTRIIAAIIATATTRASTSANTNPGINACTSTDSNYHRICREYRQKQVVVRAWPEFLVSSLNRLNPKP